MSTVATSTLSAIKPSPESFWLLAGPDVIEHDGAVNRETAQTLKAIVERLRERWDIRFFFKSSYDKANRTSVDAYRGPGVEAGLACLSAIKRDIGVPIVTDVHQVCDVEAVALVADMIQLPAFLSRQTDLLLAAGKTGLIINLKKGQFLSPHDVIHAARKIQHTGNAQVLITERGSTFGYNNLVVDMRSIPIVQSYGLPLIFDATHSIQLPGGQGTASGGEREYAAVLARAAVAAGCNGLFFETHPDPDSALCDGPNMIPLAEVEALLTTCLQLRDVLHQAGVRAEQPAERAERITSG